MKLIVVLLCLIVLMVLAWSIIKKCYANQKINLTKLSSKQIGKIIYEYALSIESKKYALDGKDVFTKKGEYRSDFLKRVNSRYSELSHVIAPNGDFSGSFLDFSLSHYIFVRRKDIPSVLSDYIVKIENDRKHMHDQMLRTHPFMTVGQFMDFRKQESGDSVGVYVIYNQSKDKYYVGQAKRLLFRVNQHFTGHGNGDVYADYVYGDKFLLQMIPLSGSGFTDIDEMERVMIDRYDAYSKGYNKTVGNK